MPTLKKAINSAIQRLARWYRGTYVPPPPNDPGSPVAFISPGHYQQPALAQMLRAIARFAKTEWRWLTPILLGLVAAAAEKLLS